MASAREEILNKLKKARHKEPDRPDFEQEVYHPLDQAPEITFKENLEKVNGKVHLFRTNESCKEELKKLFSKFNKNQICCHDDGLQKILQELGIEYTNDKDLPDTIEIGLTDCEFLIAHTGSIMVSSANSGGRQLLVYPPIHVIIAKKSQLLDYLGTAYKMIQKKYPDGLPSQITLITGPSRTADIEKTLILGAHGPRELHVFLLND